MQEKTVYTVMKLYYGPDIDCHEVPIEGYIADIYTGSCYDRMPLSMYDEIRKPGNRKWLKSA